MNLFLARLALTILILWQIILKSVYHVQKEQLVMLSELLSTHGSYALQDTIAHLVPTFQYHVPQEHSVQIQVEPNQDLKYGVSPKNSPWQPAIAVSPDITVQ